MSDLTKKQPHRGVDATFRLVGSSDMTDLLHAEKVSMKPVVNVIDTKPVTKPFTVKHSFIDGWEIDISGTKKSNAIVDFFKAQAKRAAEGKEIEKASLRMTYKDPDTGAKVPCKFKGVTFTDFDAIESGGGVEKQEHGVKLHAEEME